jgi:hypothetical protein
MRQKQSSVSNKLTLIILQPEMEGNLIFIVKIFATATLLQKKDIRTVLHNLVELTGRQLVKRFNKTFWGHYILLYKASILALLFHMPHCSYKNGTLVPIKKSLSADRDMNRASS